MSFTEPLGFAEASAAWQAEPSASSVVEPLRWLASNVSTAPSLDETQVRFLPALPLCAYFTFLLSGILCDRSARSR
jgi:hypothetical protein